MVWSSDPEKIKPWCTARQSTGPLWPIIVAVHTTSSPWSVLISHAFRVWSFEQLMRYLKQRSTALHDVKTAFNGVQWREHSVLMMYPMQQTRSFTGALWPVRVPRQA